MSDQVVLGQALRSIVLKGSEETEAYYERELAAAESERKQAEAEFKASGARRIGEIKQQIGQLLSEIKQASPERKKTLGEEVKKLNAERESLKTPPVNRFAYLDSKIKAYAGSQLLFKPLLSPQTLEKYNIAFSFNEQGRLVLDANELRESALGDKIRSGTDYIFERTQELGTKITRAADIKNIVLMDAKRLLSLQPKEIDFELIEQCHNAYNAEKAEREKKNKDIARRREESRSGIEMIKEYPDGYSFFELLPTPVYDDNGKLLHHVSLKYESDEMGHCVGRGGYNDHIGKEGWHFYSLRGANEDGVLVPHCTISIENGRLSQIKGNSNLAVKNRYVSDVRQFVRSLNMPIPDSEKKYIGYIKDVNNREVDLFDLPSGTSLNSLQLAAGDYKGVRLANIAKVGYLSFEGKVELKDYREATAIGQIDSLTLNTAEEADFYDQVSLNVNSLTIAKKMPQHLGSVENVVFNKNVEVDFSRHWENVRRLEFADTVLDARLLPVLADGIKGGIWENTEHLTSAEFLDKMFGSQWTATHCRTKNGKMIVDTDLDLSGRRLTRLPADMKNMLVKGKLDLSNNWLDDISAPLAYPDCQKMVLKNSFGVHNSRRFDTLPYLPEGIDCGSYEVDLTEQNLAEVLDKFALIDRKRIKNEQGRIVIEGDVNSNLMEAFSNVNFPNLHLEDIEVRGKFTALPEMVKFPACRTLVLNHLQQDIVVSPQTEKVEFLSWQKQINKLNGKNLKRIAYDSCYLTCEDLQAFNTDTIYEGKFYLKQKAEAEKNAAYDLSKLKIDGALMVLDNGSLEAVRRLPRCKSVTFYENVTEKELLKLHPETEELYAPNIFDLDMLPSDSHLKYFSVSRNMGRQTTDEYTDFLRQASARGIMCHSDNVLDLSQDLSDILLQKIELRWNTQLKNISTLPQMEELVIYSPRNDFDCRFLKDASPHLKVLNLSYMKVPVDFSALPKDVALQELSINDSSIQSDLLEKLPKQLETLKLLRCSPDVDLEPLNRMPHLKCLDISQMKIAEDALDRVDPKRLSALKIKGNVQFVMRAEEIKAINRLSPSKENDQIKKMHDWLIKRDNDVPYVIRKVVFYGTVNDILSGKHPQAVTAEEIAAKVKGVENFMLDNCAKIIMAEERAHQTGSEKDGRTVLEDNKGKKIGFYGHMNGYHTSNLNLSKAGKIVKSVLTRNIRHHPDFEKAEDLVAKRLSAHACSLQQNFNRQLADRGQILKTYVQAEQGKFSFNTAVRQMREYKKYG